MLEDNGQLDTTQNIEDNKLVTPTNIKVLEGMFEVVDAVPSFTPKNFYDSVKIYSGNVYIFNYKTSTWINIGSLGYTAENVANKDTDGTLAANSDTKYPSQKAIKTYVDLRELLANKDTDGTLAANSDTKYPSQKAVKTYVDSKNTDLTTLVTGESITNGNAVCIKPAYEDFIASDDAYTYQGSGNSNYGNEETLRIGQDGSGNVYEAWLKWNMASLPAPEIILKAELIISERVYTGGSATINVQRVTSADWAEGTITFNNKPSLTDDIATQFGMQKSYVTSAIGTKTLDITQLVRQWKGGAINNYGINIFGSNGASTEYDLDSSETTLGTTYKPRLRIYKSNVAETGVFKANCNSYFLSRCIVGIAQASKNISENLSIQYKGRVTNLNLSSETAGKVYLANTAGGVVTSSNSLERMITLGKIIADDECLLDIQDRGLLIEKLYTAISSTGVKRFYAPSDARFARVYFNVASSQSFYVDVYRDNDGLDTFNFGNYVVVSGKWWNFTWGSNYIDVENLSEITNIYFYS